MHAIHFEIEPQPALVLPIGFRGLLLLTASLIAFHPMVLAAICNATGRAFGKCHDPSQIVLVLPKASQELAALCVYMPFPSLESMRNVAASNSKAWKPICALS